MSRRTGPQDADCNTGLLLSTIKPVKIQTQRESKKERKA